jgi:hypothetical protein
MMTGEEQLWIFVFGFVTGVFVGNAVARLPNMRRPAWRSRQPAPGRPWTGRGPWSPKPIVRGSDRPDAVDQLRIVMEAEFTIRPLLNRGEARLFRELERLVTACNSGWQVMAQVSLGEVLRSKDAAAFGCINAKRVDLLLIDEDCRPRHAIEYQGTGHHQGTAAARDAVKKEALRRAEVGYHEVVAGRTTPSDLKRLIEKLVDKPVAAQ